MPKSVAGEESLRSLVLSCFFFLYRYFDERLYQTYFMDLLSPSQWLVLFQYYVSKFIGLGSTLCSIRSCDEWIITCTHNSIIVDQNSHTNSMRNLCNLVMQGVILPWLCITHSKVHSHTAVLLQLISLCDDYHLSNSKKLPLLERSANFHFCVLFGLHFQLFLFKLSRFVYKQTKLV